MNISFKSTKFEVDFMKNLLDRFGLEDKNYQSDISRNYPDWCFIDKTDYFIQNNLLSDLFFEFMTNYPKHIIY